MAMKPMLSKTLLTGVVALFLAPSLGLSEARREEEFQYRWQLKNLVGAVAGMFLPNRGEGSLTFRQTNGHLRSELTITSGASREGEYFRYGSEIDSRTLEPIRAWSSYSFRGETKSKSEEIAAKGVLDVAAGIYAIRQDPPTRSRRMEIWSDGKIYPVVVIPRETATRTLSGTRLQARHYQIRGVEVPGRRKWKGKLDLWLANDEAATPVEITISRNMADVRMQLKSLQ